MGFFSNKKSEEEIFEEALAENNIFEGVSCKVVFPDTDLKISTHDGFTRGVATLTLGIVGWAATSGIKQTEQNRVLQTELQVVNKGIVFKKSTRDQKDLRIPYDNIVKANRKGGMFEFTILLLENQEIHVRLFSIKGELNSPLYVRNHLTNIINERACGAQYEEGGWGLEHGTAEPQETKQENGSLLEELERLGNMYKEGLLTDDEFALAKKKLLGGD